VGHAERLGPGHRHDHRAEKMTDAAIDALFVAKKK
jgi:hypothetical protein